VTPNHAPLLNLPQEIEDKLFFYVMVQEMERRQVFSRR
jgi:hypothetical protein